MLGAYLKIVCSMSSLVLPLLKKPSNSKKRMRKDTIPQYLRKLIYKKKKMWKFMKLNKNEHAEFIYKKSL